MSSRFLAVALVAGGVCSVANAQQVVEKVSAGTRANVVNISPAYIEYEGVRYPAQASAGDADTLVYACGVDVTLPGAGYLRSTALPKRVLDRVSLFPGAGQGSGQLVNGVAVAFWSVAAVASPMQDVEVEVEILDDINVGAAANTPLASTSAGTFRMVFNPPAAGWANNTIYRGNVVSLSSLPGGGMQVADGDIAVDLRCFAPGGTGIPGLSADFTPALWDGGAAAVSNPQVGASGGNYYRDSDADGMVEAAEGFTFANRLANLAVGLQADPVATGSCCLADGTCAVVPQSGCTAWNGVYGGDGTTCSGVSCDQPSTPVYNNQYAGGAPIPAVGTFVTGATTFNNIPAPSGTAWSEMQAESTTCGNTTLGFNGSGTFRIADDFTLTESTEVDQVVVYAYVTSTHPFSDSFTSATLQIWDGPPNNPASTVVFGDTTTDRLGATAFSGVYRQGATRTGGAMDILRPVMRIPMNVGATLAAGTYWLDWNVSGPVGNFQIPATLVGSRTTPGANAIQWVQANTAWQPIVDAGAAACTTTNIPQDMAFVILGSSGGTPPCYANCDGSTATPVLNVADFTCFLQRYAAGESYANCDGSTAVPVLNVADFTCFLQSYAAGCP
jgi:hypothetical protein